MGACAKDRRCGSMAGGSNNGVNLGSVDGRGVGEGCNREGQRGSGVHVVSKEDYHQIFKE